MFVIGNFNQGDSKMKDIENYIARRYRERVFAELTPTDFNEILLDQIDELHSPIKIGPLEFKASEIIKQLRPDALENYEIKSELLGAEGRKNFDWYTSILENIEYSYCWLENPDISFASDFNFFKYKDCHRIMKEVKEESFRAVEKPEPAVIPEPQAKSDYDKALETAEDALNYAVDVLNAPFPEGETLIATDAYSSYSYADCILKAPFPLGEAAIATDAQYSYEYSQDVLHAPFPLGEAVIATNAHIFKMYKNLFPEPQVVEANVHLEVAKDLEDKKDEKINYGTFFCAASKGDLEVVKYLVELIEKDTPIATWMDSERDDDESSYAVWEAASNGHLEVVKYLVGEKGAYIGISTAFYAGTNGHLEVLKYLVDEKGAKIDDIKEAVKHCIEHGHLEVLKYLVDEKGAKINTEPIPFSPKIPNTFFCTASNGHLEVVKYFVDKKGAGCEFSNLELIKYLEEKHGTQLMFPSSSLPEPIKPIAVRTGVILQEVTEGCSCEKYAVHEGCVANEGDTWKDFTENLKVGEMSIVKDNTGECPKCGKDIKFKEYYIVTNVEFRPK